MVNICESLRVVKQLLEVVRQITSVSLADDTVIRSILTIESVSQTCRTLLSKRSTCIESESEVLQEVYVNKCVSIQCVTIVSILIEEVITQCIRLTEDRTLQTSVLLITIVVHCVTIVILHNLLVRITNIERIDRSDSSGSSKDISSRSRIARILCEVTLIVGVSSVSTYAQPLLCLILSLQTSSQTLIVRLINDTLAIEVTCRHINLSTLITR